MTDSTQQQPDAVFTSEVCTDSGASDVIHVYEFVVDQRKVYIQAKSPIQAGYGFKDRFGYWPTEANGAVKVRNVGDSSEYWSPTAGEWVPAWTWRSALG